MIIIWKNFSTTLFWHLIQENICVVFSKGHCSVCVDFCPINETFTAECFL
jgi:hypothetical protein